MPPADRPMWPLAAPGFAGRSRLLGGGLSSALAGKSLLSLMDQAVVSGASFLATVLLGRRSGLAELGLYALAFAILVVVINVHAALVVAPFTFYGNHYRHRRRLLLAGSTLVHHVLLCSVLFGLLLGAALAARWLAPAIWPVLLALACGSPFVLLKELARRYSYAQLNVRAALVIDVAAAATQIAGMALLAYYDSLNAATALAVTGAAAALPGIVWLSIVGPAMRIRARAVRPHAWRAWRFGSWVLADQMFAVASGYFSHWTLAFAIGPAATGAFSACLNVVQLANPLIFGMGNVLEPKASAAVAAGGRRALRSMVARATLLIVGAMAAFSVVFLVAGNWIVSLLYKEPIAANSPWLIPLLTLAAVLMALNVGVIHGLRAAQQSQANLAAGVANFAATLVVALVGIPRYGLLAAAAAMAAGNAAGLIVRVAWFLNLDTNPTRKRVSGDESVATNTPQSPARGNA